MHTFFFGRITMVATWLNKAKTAWHAYWFAEASSIGFAVFRIALGLFLLLYHTPRLFYVRELYTNDGYIVPVDFFRALSLPIPDFPTALFLNTILNLAILSVIAGYKTRLALFATFVLHTYFISLEYFSTVGMGPILMIYILLLMVSPAGAFLSIDYIRRHFKKLRYGVIEMFNVVEPPRVSITMQRIMLWQLASIYFFNTLSKLKHGTWFNGDALRLIYLNVGEGTYAFMPPVVKKIDWLLPNIEIMIIVGLFLLGVGLLIPFLRPYALFFGIIYHGIALLTIYVAVTFSLLMFCLYVTAVEPSTWERWWGYFQKKFLRPGIKLQDGTRTFSQQVQKRPRDRYYSGGGIFQQKTAV